MGQDGKRKQPEDGGTMSDDQGHPRSGGDAGTERELTAEVDALRVDVAALLGRFDALQRRLVGDGAGTLVEQLQDNLADVASGEVVGALWDEVRAVRSELTDGLVVEASDALSASLDALRAELDDLRGTIGDLRARLDEALVPADDSARPAAAAAVDGPGVEAVADQVAALRDFVASELDTVRQTVAAATARPEPAPAPQPQVTATMDDATVDLLRDEIRAAGAIPDQVIEALRDELKALRRRMAVKASERVLDDDQLGQIADAVAARLAEDRERA